MPTYAYRGTECGHEFETYQSFSDDPLVECLECGGPVRRVISGVGVTFKGSGFYRTDSRAEGTKAGKGKGTGGSDSASSTTPAPAASTSSSNTSPASSSASAGSTSGSAGS
ncbi:MAG: FmdB family transcriptional regulator [Micrococcales bacterium 73-15]|uniref:FmdB family zinc ribbon protein n=1 Tax=Salana multivorans TaxID=120377 RepID=UPI00095D6751|nr:FmdB family zinc ribbon protein [Salana multivorans]OJX94101.1 MAG: FmdB family transcriptional regulator [Micrococcales bacterium 73-15]